MKDILLDTVDFDVLIQDGDFVAGESTQQHQALLLLIEKGELREFPTRGIGAQTWINDDSQAGDFNAAVKKEFETDGMRVLSLKGSPINLKVEAYYD